MATIEELKEVIKETLEEKNVLSQIKAKVRAEIFSSLNDQPSNKKKLSEENLLINELIREYLIFNNYQHSQAVFIPESNQPIVPPLTRFDLSRKLKLEENKDSKQVPLLYGIIFGKKYFKESEQDFTQKKGPEISRLEQGTQQQQQQDNDSKNIGKNMFSTFNNNK